MNKPILALSLVLIIYLPTISCNDKVFVNFLGNLTSQWSMNLTLQKKPFRGSIINCKDAGKNSLQLYISDLDSMPRKISLSFNKYVLSTNSYVLCGCDVCDDSMLIFKLEFSAGLILLSCNEMKVMKIDVKEINVPNLQPHSFMRTTINYGKEGCFDSYYYNKQLFSYDDIDSNDLTKCSRTRIKSYDPNSINSYQVLANVTDIDLQLYWKSSQKKRYCLLEVTHSFGNVAFSVYKQCLFLDSVVLLHFNNDNSVSPNHIMMSLNKTNLIIRIENLTKVIEILQFEDTIINVGMSQKSNPCEVYKGLYDFRFDSRKMRKQKFAGTKVSTKVIFILIGASISAMLFLVVIVAIIIYKCKNKAPARATEVVQRSIALENRPKGAKSYYEPLRKNMQEKPKEKKRELSNLYERENGFGPQRPPRDNGIIGIQ